MIKKRILFFCNFLFFAFFNQAQSITEILQQIEQNNSKLKAFKHYEKNQKLSLKTTNTLPDLEIGAYFLPFGNKDSQNYTEIEVKQQFEFPTVYIARKNVIAKQYEYMNIEYQQKRQEILLQAKQLLQKIIAINKLEKMTKERLKNAKKLFVQNQQLFKKGEIGILEFNKSKIAFLKCQFNIKNIQTKRKNKLIRLKNLNGGEPLLVPFSDFEQDVITSDKLTLWKEYISQSNNLLAQQKTLEIAIEKNNLAKKQILPSLSAGYNYQGVAENKIHGFFAGINIPIWRNNLGYKAAKMQILFEESNTNAQKLTIQSKFEIQYNDYQTILSKYREYKKTLGALNSEELLYKAYHLGEISFSEYFMELEFYHTAQDVMLDMEKQLHLLKSQLLYYKL